MPAGPDSRSLDELLPRVPLFAKLKPKMMAALAEELRFETCMPGKVLLRQGEYTEELFIVLEGIATAYRTESDGTTENLGSCGVHDWFGEMTPLANQAQYSTVTAETECTLMVVDAPLFKKLYTGGGSFKDLIDERYRERALSIHLRTAPLFKGVPRRVLKELAEGVRLETVPEGKPIVKAGSVADGVYLVRSGIVKEVSKGPGGEEVVAYHCDNASFGERTLTGEPVHPHDFVALSRVDVVVVDGDALRALEERDKATHTQLQMTAFTLLNMEDAKNRPQADIQDLSRTMVIDLMVGKQAVKGGEALVIDLQKCTRCNACVEGCVSVHEDRVPRLSKQGIRVGDLTLTSACYNCKIPECMLGCNYGAIRRDVNGAIHFIEDNCTGCTACERKCPYGVIRMTALVDPEEEARESRTFFQKLFPFLGRANEPQAPPEEAEDGKPKKPVMKAIKCDLCAGLPFEACVYNCPCGAIGRVAPESLVS